MFDTHSQISQPRFPSIFQDTWFKVGFCTGIAAFVLFNYLSFAIAYGEYISPKVVKFSAGGYFAGFPFRAFHQYHGYPSGSDLLIFGLTADVLIALLSAFVLGLLFRYSYLKFIMKILR